MSYENLLELIRLCVFSDFSPAGKLDEIERCISEFSEFREKQDEDIG